MSWVVLIQKRQEVTIQMGIDGKEQVMEPDGVSCYWSFEVPGVSLVRSSMLSRTEWKVKRIMYRKAGFFEGVSRSGLMTRMNESIRINKQKVNATNSEWRRKEIKEVMILWLFDPRKSSEIWMQVRVGDARRSGRQHQLFCPNWFFWLAIFFSLQFPVSGLCLLAFARVG
jgi:hypothetical protein